MIKNLNLDDKTFENLVDEALEELHRYNGAWTDHNLHDPGITFIELFAWLTEMQRFYMNRMTRACQLKLFGLLGFDLKEQQQASSKVVINNVKEDMLLLEGTPFEADHLVFQTTSSQWLLDNSLQYIYVEEAHKLNSKNRENSYKDIYFYPFGKKIIKNNKLYLGFEKPMLNRLTLTFIGRKGAETEMTLPVDIQWEFFSKRETWEPIQPVLDETNGLISTGRISFDVTEGMAIKEIKNGEPAYWIRGVVLKDYTEIPKNLDGIVLNMVDVQHKSDWIHTSVFSILKEKSTYSLDHYLQIFGESFIQGLTEDHGWEDVNVIHREDLKLFFKGMILDKENMCLTLNESCVYKKIRIISGTIDMFDYIFFDSSKGTAYQKFHLQLKDMTHKSLRISIGEYEDGMLSWQDWEEVEDFDLSGPNDRHYKIDYEKNQLLFGDHVHGKVPVEGESNIRIIGLAIGGGQKGNIRCEEIKTLACDQKMFEMIYQKNNALTISNPYSTMGGLDKEAISSMHKRLLEDMEQPYITNTSDDFEVLLNQVKGIELERSHVISNFALDQPCYGHNTIVVMPKSEDLTIQPSVHFKETVHHYLEPYRLLTTRNHVIGPNYVEVVVEGIVHVMDHVIVEDVSIEGVLLELLNPKAYPFGETISKSKIYRGIASVEGVSRIENLSIRTINQNAVLKGNGDIQLSAFCLPYLGDNRIQIIGR